MVHSKYTKKNGKLYGPYLYENKRVGEKVVTEYLGRGEQKKGISVIVYTLVGILVLAGLLFFMFQAGSPTGHVALSVSDNLINGELITGKLNLELKEGEFLSADSIVRATLNGQTKEFKLSELIDSQVSSGVFYAEGVSLNGEGEGYGVAGKKKIYPELSFKLRIVGSSNSDSSGDSDSSDNKTQSGDDSGSSSGDSSDSDSGDSSSDSSDSGSSSGSDSGSSSSEGSSSGDSGSEGSENSNSANKENTNDNEKSSDNGNKESGKGSDGSNGKDNSKGSSKGSSSSGSSGSGSSSGSDSSSGDSGSSSSGSDSGSSNGGGESSSSSSSSGDSGGSSSGGDSSGGSSGGDSGSSSAGGDSGGGITGAVIKGFVTGRVVSEIVSSEEGNNEEDSQSISGRVSKEKDFSYQLKEGESAELVPGSVEYNGSVIEDSEVKVKSKSGEVEVSTNYFVEEEGFGESYLGGKGLELKIDISAFGVNASAGTLNFEIVYDSQTIVEVSKEINVDETSGNLTTISNLTSNLTEDTIAGLLNQTNITIDLTNQTNVTILNETNFTIGNVSIVLLKDVPTIKLAKNNSVEINLSEHFSGAESYNFSALNVSGESVGEILILTAQEGFSGTNKGKITAYFENESLESNQFNILVSSGAMRISTSRERIVVGQPVKWTQNVSLETPENVSIELPAGAENISVKKNDELSGEVIEARSLISGNVVATIEDDKEGLVYWLANIFRSMTARVIDAPVVENATTADAPVSVTINDSATEYVIEYQTEAPISAEEDTSYGKKGIVSGPDALNYTDVLSFANISEVYSTEQSNLIKIFWVENVSYLPFDAYDLDANGMIDYIEWNVPHLSNQTFEIILITQAEHLDENRTFIEDVYPQVGTLDGVSKVVPSGHYVRVYFEKNLTNVNDVTLYARATSDGLNSEVKVFEIDSEVELASLANISYSNSSFSEYKTILTALAGEQDRFDLLVSGADIEIDYIVDPTITNVVPNATSQVIWFGNMTEITNPDGVNPVPTNRYTLPVNCAGYISATGDKGACLNLGGTAALDPFFLFNVTTPNYQIINNITITSISAKILNVVENLSLAVYNYSSSSFKRVANSVNPTLNVNTTLTYVISGSELSNFVSGNKMAILSYSQGTNNADMSQEYLNVRFEYVSKPVITLISPDTSSMVYSDTVYFVANISSDPANTLVNTTLFVWNSTGSLISSTDISISGLTNSSNTSVVLPNDGTFYWNYRAFDNESNSDYAPSNFSIFYQRVPIINSVVMNATTIGNLSTDNLNGYVSASDANNISLVYNWYKEGVLNATNAFVNDSSLLLYLSFNNDTRDYAGSFDGTLYGSIVLNSSGMVGSAYEFDGSTANISIPNLDSNNFTLSAWIKRDNIDKGGNGDTIVSGNLNGWILYINPNGDGNDDKLVLSKQGVDGSWSTGTITDTNWHFVALVFESSTSASFYIDGALDVTNAYATSFDSSGGSYLIGENAASSSGAFDGKIDEVQIYNRSLSASEIQQLYTGSRWGGNVLGSTQLTAGDNWTLGVKAGDYLGFSAETNSSNLFVRTDSTPTISSVLLNATSVFNLTSDNLTGYVSASDVDGQALSFAYNWYKEGVLNATTAFIDDSSLKLYLPFNNDTKDYALSNDGTAYGNAFVNTTDSKVGGVLQLDGTGDYVKMADSPSINLVTGNQTISFWVKRLTTGSYEVLVDKNTATPEPIYIRFENNNVIYIQIYYDAGNYWYAFSTSTFTDTNWHNLAFILNYDDWSETKMYLDGNLETLSGATQVGVEQTLTNTGSLSLGISNDGVNYPLNGYLDEVQIYNRSLSATEIQQLYTGSRLGGNVMDYTQLTAGDNWTVGVKAGDFNSWSAETNSSNLLVKANSAPVIDSILLNATSALNVTTDNLNGYVTASDTENDNITLAYNWYKNNVLNATSIFISDSDLVSYHPFDNNVLDYARGFDGTVYDNAALNTTARVIGNSFNFDGSEDYVSIGDIDLDYNMTISVWVKTLQGGGSIGIVTKSDSPAVYYPFELTIEGGGGACIGLSADSGGTGYDPTCTLSISDNNWHHVVATYRYEGSNLSIYLDGAVSSSKTFVGPMFFDNNPVRVGRHPYNIPNRDFAGQIDELQIYNRSLSASEVQQLYTGSRYGGNVIQGLYYTQAGQNWTFGVKAGDPSSWSAETNSSPLIVNANNPPAISSVVLNATSSLNVTSDNLTGYVGYSDAEGEAGTLVYNWYENGILNGTTSFIDDSSLKVYFPFNNDTKDYALANDVTSSYGEVFLNYSGKIGGAYSFDGTGDYLMTGNYLTADNAPFSVSVWVYPLITNYAVNGAAAIFGYANGAGEHFSLIAGDNVIGANWRVYMPGSGYSTGSAINQNEWYHLVYLFDGTNVALYVNGVQDIAPTANSYTGANIPITIGRWYSDTYDQFYFNGTIDEFQFYNRSLSVSEIQQLYTGSRAGGSALKGLYHTQAGQNWTLGVRAGDYLSWSAETNSSPLTINANPTPSVDSVILNSTSALNLTNDNLTGYVISSDSNGDAVSLVYNWYENNTLNATSAFIDDSSLKLYLPFNNDTLDYALSNDGTVYGNAFVNTTETRMGGALQLDGIGDYLTIPDDDSLTPGADGFALMTLFKGTASNEYGSLAVKYKAGDTNREWYISLDCDSSEAYIDVIIYDHSNNAYIGQRQATSIGVCDGEWHQVGFNWDGTTAGTGVKIYKDGTVVATSSQFDFGTFVDVDNGDQPVRVGISNWAGTYVNGSIDELQIYNRSLSASEIQKLYTGGRWRGNVLGKQQTTSGDNWTLGVKAGDYLGWSAETNSSSLEILPGYFNIDFTNPTPANSGAMVGGAVFVNVSVDSVTDSEVNISSFIDFDNSLQAWWRMDDVNGSGEVVDYLGRYNLSKYGGAVQSSDGKLNASFAFDGTGDYIKSAPTTLFNNWIEFTLNYWYKYDSQGNAVFFDKAQTSSPGQLYVYSWAGTLNPTIVDNLGAGIDTQIAEPADTNWHMITIAWGASVDSGNLNVYLDGYLPTQTGQQAQTNPMSTNTIEMFMGAYSDAAQLFLNGKMDDIMIFNRTLTANEISMLYANTTSKYYSRNFTGLASGTHTFKAYAQDGAGKVNTTELRSVSDVVADTTAPRVTIVRPQNITYNSLPLLFNISLNENGTAWYSLDGGAVNYTMTGNESADFGTMFNATNTSIADGSYTFYAYANDTAGNKNYTESVVFSVDRTAPTLTVNSPVNNSNFNTTTVNFTATGSETLSWCGLSIDGTANVTMSILGTTIGNYTNTSMAQGNHNFIISCNDSANNFVSSASLNLLVDSGYPGITYGTLTPSTGTTQSGNSIYVNATATDTLTNVSTFVDFDNSLVSWWRMDDVNQTGLGAKVYDYFGKNNGTAYGAAVQNDSGVLGKSFTFDGADDYIQVSANSAGLAGFSTITVSSWVNSIFGGGVIVASHDGGAWNFEFEDNYWSIINSSGSLFQNGFTSATGLGWTHLVGVYNGTTLLVYKNGVLFDSDTTASGPLRANSYPAWIGARSSSGPQDEFNGNIDDVMIFNRSLSAGEIASLYSNQTTKYYTNNFTSLSAGAHTFKVYTQDYAGNVNTTELRTVTTGADLTAPTITLNAPANNSNFNTTTVNFTATSSETISWCGLSIDGTANVTMSILGTTIGNYTNTSMAQGNHNFIISCNDSANNFVSSASLLLLVDSGYPGITYGTLTPATGSTQSGNSIYINATATDTLTNVSTFVDFDNSLVSWWRMDDLNASGGVVDYLGRNNGTNVGANQTSAGKMGKGMSFDGSDRVIIAHKASLNITKNLTLSLWVKLNSNPDAAYHTIINKGWSTSGSYYLDIDKSSITGKVQFWVKNITGTAITVHSNSAVVKDVWYHLVTIYNGTNAFMYVNGVKQSDVDSITGDIGISSDLSLAGVSAGDLNATLDDFMIFNRSLSDVEVALLYANQTTKYYTNNFSSLAEGSHTFKAYTQDYAGNVNFTTLNTVTVDATAPKVNLNSPVNNSNFSTRTVWFASNFTDGTGLLNATLYVWNSTNSLINATENVSISGTANSSNISIVLPADGMFLWNYFVVDSAGNNAFNATNWTLNVDTSAPTLTVNVPVNNSNFNTTTVNFTATGSETLSWCGLSIDGTANVTMSASGTLGNYTNTTMTQGQHSFIISCNDTSNNFVSSASLNLLVDNGYPSIDYGTLTPATGSTQSGNSIYVNATASDTLTNVSTFVDFDNSLVSWWRMDDLNASGGVVDYMGRNNGTNSGANQTDAGKMGKAMSFDGVDDYVQISGHVVNSSKAWTFSLWAKRADSSTSAFSLFNFGNNRRILIEASALRFRADGVNTDGVSSVTSSNGWVHILGVYNTTDLTLYLNSAVENSATVAIGDTSTSPAQIGKIEAGQPMNGSIDDVMIFNRSLSAGEIASLYANQTTKYYTNNFTSLSAGSHTFKAYTQDYAGNVNATELRTVTTGADLTAPTITINAPANNSNFNTTTVNFTVTGSETVSWCGLSIDGTANVTMTILGTTIGNYTNNSMVQGNHNFIISCNDTANNYVSSASLKLLVDSGYPSIDYGTLTPATGSTQSGNSIYVNVTATDTLTNVSTFVDFDGSLVSWWRMEQGNGTYFVDEIGNANGSCSGATCPNFSLAGKLGGAYSFDGVNDYVDLSTNTRYVLNSTGAVSLWFKRDSIQASYAILVVKGGDMVAGEGAWVVYTSSTSVVLRLMNTTTYQDISLGTAGSTDVWYHLSASWNGSSVVSSLNGVVSTNAQTLIPVNSTNALFQMLRLGARGYLTGSRFFNGSIDDVMIFNRSLSAGEVALLYANQTTKYYTNNFTSLSAGAHTFKAYTQDYAGNVNTTELRTVTTGADLTAPTITLNAPANNSNFNTTTVNFTATSSETISWCGLSIDGTANVTMSILGTTIGNYTNTSMAQGNHNFIISCNDSANNFVSSASLNLLVDSSYPGITYGTLTPSTGTTQSGNSIYVNATASDTLTNVSTFVDFDNSLVSWWRMDDLNSSGGVVDYMGRNNGTNVGANQTDAGKMGKGMSFDGTNDAITLANSASYVFETRPFSIGTWVKFDSIGASVTNGIINTWTGSGGVSYFSLYDVDALVFMVRNNSATAFSVSTTTIKGTGWRYVVATRNATFLSIYVDGVLMKNSTLPEGYNISNSAPISIGRGYANGYYMNGSIDDLMLFNRSLSAGEVASLYANQTTKYYSNNFAALADGSHTFKAYTQDYAGNVNTTELRTVTIQSDMTAPTLTINSLVNNSNFNTTTVNFTATGSETLSWCGLSIDGTANVTMTILGTTIGNYTNASMTNGNHNFIISCNDTTNNFANTGVNFLLVDNGYPQISYGTNTPADLSTTSGNSIYVNATATDTLTNVSTFVDFDNSLVSWWRMDDLNASGGVLDYMGRNNGTNVGANQTSAGRFGSAMSFDGVDDRVLLANSSTIHPSNQDFTVLAWVRPIKATTNEIFSDYYGGSDPYLQFFIDSTSNLRVTIRDNNTYVNNTISTSGGLVGINAWSFVGFTYVYHSETGLNLYINGDLKTTVNVSKYDDISHDRNSFIGSLSNVAGTYFNGSIDDVMIFNRSLSAGEVASLYANQTTKYYSNNFAALADGSHTFKAYTQDYAGNVNMTELRTATTGADLTAPLVTIVLPANVTYNALPLLFNISLNENGTAWYSLNGGAVNYTMSGNESADFGTMFNATNTSIADGSYTFRAYANDTAGNTNYTESVVFSVDRTAPLVTINSPTGNLSVSQVTFNVTTNENADTAQFSLDGGAINVTMQNNGNVDFNYTNSSIADGTYTVNFYVNDSAGNWNRTESFVFTIDTTYPVFSANETNLTSSTAVGAQVYFNITLTEANPLNYTLSWYNGTGWENTTGSYSNGQEVSVLKTINTDLGQINWTWYANDSSGNTNQTDVWSVSLVYDDQTAPTLTLNSPLNNSNSSSQSVVFNSTANEVLSWCGLSIDGATNVSMTVSGAGANYTNGSISEGTHNFIVSCNDTSNNYASIGIYYFTIDLTAPAVSIIYPANISYTYNVSAINYSSSESGNCWYSNNSGIWNSSAVSAGTNFTSVTSVEGSNSWRVYCNDSSGNVGSNSVDFAKDVTLPVVNLLAPANGSSFASRTIWFASNFSDNSALLNATLYVWNSTGSLINATENVSISGTLNMSNISVVLPYDGTFLWNYFVVDSVGNSAFNETNWTLSVDTVVPGVTITSPLNVTYVSSDLPILFNVSLSENGSVRYSLDNGVNNISMSSLDNRNFSSTNASLASGSYTFRVYANDTAGNTNYTESVVFSFGLTNLTACGTLNRDNTAYSLGSNVNSSGTCFTVSADNVSLNCNGYMINYSQSIVGYGINARHKTNFTLNNCNIYNGNNSVSFAYGVYAYNMTNSLIESTNVTTNASNPGVSNYPFVIVQAINTTARGNRFVAQGNRSYGVYLSHSLLTVPSNAVIENNTILASGLDSYGVVDYYPNGNKFSGNTITLSGTGAGAGIFEAYNRLNGNVTISGNTITTNSNLISQYGVYLYTSYNVSVLSNTFSSASAIAVSKSANSYLRGNLISGPGISTYNSFGLILTNSSRVDFAGNRIENEGRGIIVVNAGLNNLIYENNISLYQSGASWPYGIYVGQGASQNNVSNNRVLAGPRIALYLGYNSYNNSIYNNFLNTSYAYPFYYVSNLAYTHSTADFNTSLTAGTNIVDGNLMGGNYYATTTKRGFSQTCPDSDNNAICDSTYSLNSYHKDYLALTKLDTEAPSIIEITYLENNSFVNGGITIKAEAVDNVGVKEVYFQYKNSTVDWTNFTDCSDSIAPYICVWQAGNYMYSNNSEGYDVKVIAYDYSGNNAYNLSHYTIDRLKPILYDSLIIYPNGQSSARTGQIVQLRANVTDSPEVGAGINNSVLNVSLLNGSSTYQAMEMIAGSLSAQEESIWEKNITISATSSGYIPATLKVADRAIPTANVMTAGSYWRVYVDNSIPTYAFLEVAGTDSVIYNNTDVSFSMEAEDNYQLESYIFSTNMSGTWVNDSAVAFTGGTIEDISVVKRASAGTHGYRFYVSDDAGNVNDTGIGLFEVSSLSSPTSAIVLDSPADLYASSSSTIDFSYSYTGGSASNCTLMINDADNLTEQNPAPITSLSFQQSFVDGTYSWRIRCEVTQTLGENETVSSAFYSDTRTFLTDTAVPAVKIDSPTSSNYTLQEMKFNVTAYDRIDSCIVSLDDWATEYVMSEINSTLYNATLLLANSGSYTGKVSCNNSAGSVNNSVRVNFISDFNAPSVALAGANGSSTQSSTNSFAAQFIDDFALANATLYLWNSTGSLINSTELIAISGVTNSSNISVVLSSQGNYSWNYLVVDRFGNFAFNKTNFSIEYSILDLTSPVLTNNETNLTNLTAVGEQVYFNVTLTETNPDKYVFSFYNGTNWENTTGSYTNGQEVSVLKTINIDVGQINWSWFANDTIGNRNQSIVYSVGLVYDDQTAPTVILLNPGNGVDYSATSQSVIFQYNVSENVSYCNLSVSSVVVNSSLSGTGFANYAVNFSAGAVNEFVNVFSVGSYSWSVLCLDLVGNSNTSLTKTFSVTAPIVSAPSTSSSSGGGGGGGGSTLVSNKTVSIEFNPASLDVSMVSGNNESRTVVLRNKGSSSVSFDVSVEGSELTNVLTLNNKIIVGAGESANLEVKVSAESKGLTTGKIVFKSGELVYSLPVVINVRSENFLFDASISVMNSLRKLVKGNVPKAQVNLLQVGQKSKVDVVANYVIKDFSGNVVLEEHETFFVLNAKDFVKEFPTLDLSPGKYIIGLELSYPGAFATSSAQFEVLGEEQARTLRYAGIIVGIAVLGLVSWLGWRLLRRRKL